MKIRITILLTLTVLAALGQNQKPRELGIGFAVATEPYQFEDLSHPEIFADKELSTKRKSDAIFPFFYKPDYGLYHFICLEKTREYYKILINDNETGFIPNNSGFLFKSWDAILLPSLVERKTKTSPIRKNWTDQSEIIQNDCGSDRLKVEDVIEKDGEYWLKISFSPECEGYPDKNGPLKYGWLKWRTEDELLVNILLLC